MKIYDCFPFFNETELLRIRLNILWKDVDYFVICESSRTFSGNAKAQNFNWADFEEYKEKIRYLYYEGNGLPSNIGVWEFQREQRNYLLKGLDDAKPNDLIMLSDLDEIINPEMIKSFNPKKYYSGVFLQKEYVFYLNNQVFINKKPMLWSVAKITTYENLLSFFKSFEELRKYKGKGLLRGLVKTYLKLFKQQKITNGGWHFSWMGGVQSIILKMKSISEKKYRENKDFMNNDFVLDQIKNGNTFIIGDKRAYSVVIEDNLPQYIKTNKALYKNYFLE